MRAENAEQALAAREKGERFFRSGDYERAIKFLNISLRLSDNPDTRQTLSSAKAAAARSTRPVYCRRCYRTSFNCACGAGAGAAAAAGANAGADAGAAAGAEPQRAPQARPEATPAQYPWERWIHPDYRRPIRWMLVAILALAAYRVFVGRPTLGSLPGDYSYRGSNVYVSAPLGSSLLLSAFATFMLNGGRWPGRR